MSRKVQSGPVSIDELRLKIKDVERLELPFVGINNNRLETDHTQLEEFAVATDFQNESIKLE